MKVKKIYKQICNLSITEIFDLFQKLKKRFNISEVVNTNSNTETKVKYFYVNILSLGPSKIMIIKFLKDLTGLDLLSSKKLIDNLPCKIKKQFKKPEANKIKTDLEKLGCVVNLE
ncbi:ribosomal protein L7/L12 [Candidatus Vidania fulgoroideorum]